MKKLWRNWEYIFFFADLITFMMKIIILFEKFTIKNHGTNSTLNYKILLKLDRFLNKKGNKIPPIDIFHTEMPLIKTLLKNLQKI